MKRRVLPLALAAALLAASILFGAYRDARASSHAKTDTITLLAGRLGSLEYRVAQLERQVRNDESTLSRICSHRRVVVDVSTYGTPSVSPVYAYC